MYKPFKTKGGWIAAGHCGRGVWMPIGEKRATRAEAAKDCAFYRKVTALEKRNVGALTQADLSNPVQL